MSNYTPHVHAEVIKAWADGKPVQCKNKNNTRWTDLLNQTPPQWHKDMDYRIKPEGKWYRVGLYKSGNVFTTNSLITEKIWEESHLFDRWITDRIEYS